MGLSTCVVYEGALHVVFAAATAAAATAAVIAAAAALAAWTIGLVVRLQVVSLTHPKSRSTQTLHNCYQ